MKAKVIVEFRGRKYRLCKDLDCKHKSKKDCSFFVKGVCDVYGWGRKLPCEEIALAIEEATGDWFCGGFKEVK